jgi:RNA polymerase-binding transcription factor DksA
MADPADMASDAENKAMERFEQERLARIAESFRPATPDEELRCVDCAELIGTARLKANPRASRCTACGTAVEQRGFQ